MALLIRGATVKDAHDYATVHVYSWQAAYQHIIPDDYLGQLDIDNISERFAKGFIKYKDKTHYYIAELDGKAIGNLALGNCRDVDKPKFGEIIAIYLLSSYWGSGYGKKIMDFGIDRLRKLGYYDCCLWVLEENTRAIRFYEIMDFSLMGQKRKSLLEKP